MIPIHLERAGARWWHSHDHYSPNLSKASLGNFFYALLKEGAHIGDIWVFNKDFHRSSVFVSVCMTDQMKNKIEGETPFRFREPVIPHLN